MVVMILTLSHCNLLENKAVHALFTKERDRFRPKGVYMADVYS